MRETEFRDWLSRRAYNGQPLAQTARNSRMGWLRALERSLPDLGFPQGGLDQVHSAGIWNELLEAIAAVRKDWRSNEAAARAMAPQAENPAKQINSIQAVARLYGHFADGDDPNYDANQKGVAPDGSWAALERMKDVFLSRMPDFEDFTQTSGRYWQGEREYKDLMVSRSREIAGSATNDADAGHAIYDVLIPQSGPPLRWQTIDAVHKADAALAMRFDEVLGRLARSDAPIVDAIVTAAGELEALQEEGLTGLSRGERLSIVFTIAGAVRPDQSAFFKTRKASKLLRELGEPALFRTPLTRREDVEAWLSLLRRIASVMVDEWGWHPRDLLDVQGFAWVVLDDNWGDATHDDDGSEVAPAEGRASKGAIMPDPVNLILYGPPGTGKTYATAEEAVKLCDGTAPANRTALMARYHELVEARRIAFVTFHQSFSYEDFIEGLRPAVPVTEGEGSTAGFTLQAEPGIFRQIAERAQTARAGEGEQTLDLTDRPVFKMSLGELADSASDFVFKEAVSGGYALLGFNDIDWSDPRFEEREEIFEAVRERFPDQEFTPNKGAVRSPDVFRNQLQVGDVLIAAKGNRKFRAVGVVEGEYEYAPRPDGRYCHRRKVRWLWSDPDGRDVADIYPPKFIQNTIYRLKDAELDRPALAALIAGASHSAAPPAPLPHVLVIDEINRANISRVFGELITLLEPDKRLGMPNALTVRLPYSKREFGVPANLHVVGTMNTADRSIALLDTALRRRFRFRELAPDTNVEAFQEAVRETGLPLDTILDTINDRIEYLIDREHRIGHAFFIGCTSRADVDATMRDKVIPLLQEYFFEDWGRVAAVLGEPQGKGGGFLDCRRLSDPMGQDGEERESWSVRSAFAPGAYDRLIGRPALAVPVEHPLDEAAE